MPPSSSLGDSILLAATHPLLVVTGTLRIGMVLSAFGKPSSEEKKPPTWQRGQELGQILKVELCFCTGIDIRRLLASGEILVCTH